jgi:hypothetical protein
MEDIKNKIRRNISLEPPSASMPIQELSSVQTVIVGKSLCGAHSSPGAQAIKQRGQQRLPGRRVEPFLQNFFFQFLEQDASTGAGAVVVGVGLVGVGYCVGEIVGTTHC